jgi:hypothetical protein
MKSPTSRASQFAAKREASSSHSTATAPILSSVPTTLSGWAQWQAKKCMAKVHSSPYKVCSVGGAVR